MIQTRKPVTLRVIALFMLFTFLSSIFNPSQVIANSGPNSPEFSTFTPVSTNDMVHPFTGDFTYNLPVIQIPGADGGGYALSLSYNSGVTMEQDPSWVGLGWSLSPGSITRNKRGFPDDSNGDPITFYNKTRPNWSVSMAANLGGIEAFSVDIPINLSKSLRFNNHQGYQGGASLGFSYKGMASLNMNFNGDGTTYSAQLNPKGIINRVSGTNTTNTAHTYEGNTSYLRSYDNSTMLAQLRASIQNMPRNYFNGKIGRLFNTQTYAHSPRSTHYVPHKGFSFNWSASLGANPLQPPIGAEIGATGNFNMQYNVFKKVRQAFGYMYTPNSASNNTMMDYYVEKNSPFDKRDHFISIPFNNHDIFSVQGEGIAGGFRVFKNSVGHYYPNTDDTNVPVGNIGVEVMLGLNNGVGVDVGAGVQNTANRNWSTTNNGSFSQEHTFRFNNDLGGKVEYSNSNDIESSKLIPSLDLSLMQPDMNNSYNMEENAGQSAHISCEENEEGKISSFSIFNGQGQNYTYGLPVNVRNETNLSIDVKRGEDEILSNYLAFKKLYLSTDNIDYLINDENIKLHKIAVGEITNKHYAQNYLLTQITEPNYVDINENKEVDQGDFGGWTKFDYRQKYGGDEEWYRYRMPYNGLIYQQNMVSDTKDDVGSVMTGEKEIYYLKSIQTKTHIAYFITNKSDETDFPDSPYLKGSQNPRLDGFGAIPITETGDEAAEKGESPKQGDTELEYLEKIVLFPKNKEGNPILEKPLQTVRFDYNYELIPNVPNNTNSTYNYNDDNQNNSENTGKLTLKRVWIEHDGTLPAKISPYEFAYSYKHSSQVEVGQEYFQPYDALSDQMQNPVYAPENLDPWGSIMPNGVERKQKGIPWVDQAYAGTFDPACWQLKQIKLPTGGEIHVQYEEKDYAVVQDRDVMAMATLLKAVDEEEMNFLNYKKNYTYYVDPKDLGADPNNPEEVSQLVKKIIRHFTGASLANKPYGASNKVYFKFLYALVGGGASLDDCKSEYIDGYSNFLSAEAVEWNNKQAIAITLGAEIGDDGARAPVPRQACFELVVNQRQGKLATSDCVEPLYEKTYEALCEQAANENDINGVLARVQIAIGSMTQMSFDPQLLFYNNIEKFEVCKSLNTELSFIKLPMLKAKRGGGVRVKRLLMYDKGIEEGDAAIYGTEYKYVLSDGVTSSGVATNEPTKAREENPLVMFLPKGEQSAFDRIISGEDKEQTEGPIGESILPPSSIGHSRVVVKNINSGKSGTGFTVHEYFTAKDYPVDRYYKEDGINGWGMQYNELDHKEFNELIGAMLLGISTDQAWATQGFRFIINKMHGQMKRVASFGGSYTGPEEEDFQNDEQNGYLVSSQEYNYYEPGEQVKLWKWNQDENTLQEYFDTPGKEMDISMESKKLEDYTADISVEVDLSAGVSFLPPIFIGIVPMFSLSSKLMATHSTTKTISYPAIQKSVLSYQDGIYTLQENVAFDHATGQVLLTKNTDGFDGLNLAGNPASHNGSIYAMNIPAYWMYEKMGQKSEGLSNTNQLSVTTATLTTYGEMPDPDWFSQPKNILNVGVQTFHDGWDESWADKKIDSLYNLPNEIEQLKPIWRPQSTYVYDHPQASSVAANKIYESGYHDINQFFDWNTAYNGNEQVDPNWLRMNEVVIYSPNGDPLEEKNILDLKNAVLFGNYSGKLPIMMGQNAEFHNLYFQSYENELDVTDSVAHSGTKSKKCTIGENEILSNVFVTDHLKKTGGLFKCWMYFPEEEPENNMQIHIGAHVAELNKVAQSGIWSLFEVLIPAEVFETLNEEEVQIVLHSLVPSYIDDVRFQPANSEAMCYVYDVKTLRLLTQFDDQHFGLYYQYNDEGKLIRKLIETERGLKTVQETQYSIPKVNR